MFGFVWCVKCFIVYHHRNRYIFSIFHLHQKSLIFTNHLICTIFECFSFQCNRLLPFPMLGNWGPSQLLAYAYRTLLNDAAVTKSRKILFLSMNGKGENYSDWLTAQLCQTNTNLSHHSHWSSILWNLACLRSMLALSLPLMLAASTPMLRVNRNCYCLTMSSPYLNVFLNECPKYFLKDYFVRVRTIGSISSTWWWITYLTESSR